MKAMAYISVSKEGVKMFSPETKKSESTHTAQARGRTWTLYHFMLDKPYATEQWSLEWSDIIFDVTF